MASSHHFMANRCEKKWKHWQILFSWAPKSLRTVIVATKLKDAWSFEENVWQTYTVCIKKQRYHFAHKDLYNQSYGFYGSHVQMWELHHKEGWAPKNWCFWIVVLEKTLESPLDSKEIQPVNPKGNQSWIFIGRIYAEVSILWPLDVKNWLSG